MLYSNFAETLQVTDKRPVKRKKAAAAPSFVACEEANKVATAAPPKKRATNPKPAPAPAMIEVDVGLGPDVRLAQSAKISQSDAIFLPEQGRGYQCTGIATYSIVAFCTWKPPFSREQLDRIVVEGDGYYQACRGRATHQHPFLSVEDLIPEVVFGGTEKRLTVMHCGDGNFTATSETRLCDVLGTALPLQIPGHTGFLFVGHSKSVSVIQATKPGSDEPSAGFWIFNSHPVDRTNDFPKRGKGLARLFHAYSLRGLTKLLLQGHPRDDAYWQMYMVNVT